jgi:hypothetical protein
MSIVEAYIQKFCLMANMFPQVLKHYNILSNIFMMSVDLYIGVYHIWKG